MPIFNPKKWHACSEEDWRECDKGVNCYSYVLDRPDYYWSVPGLGYAKMRAQSFFEAFNAHFAGVSFPAFRQGLLDGAVRDGLLRVDAPVHCDGYYLAVLLFPETGHDFHLYRKDDSGSWSHKDGWQPSKSTDAHGSLITDPLADARPLYPVLGSYFLVPRNGVILNPSQAFN